MHRPLPLPPWPEMESTTNAEFRGFDSHSSDEQQQLADQYRTMRELLKIYGVNVAESTQNPLAVAEEKNHGGDDHPVDTITSGLPFQALPTPLPSELLRSAFTEQLSNKWLEMCRINSLRGNNSNHSQLPPSAGGVADNILSGRRSATEENSPHLLPEHFLRRFDSANDCGEIDCLLQQLRDHYHCEDKYCVREHLDGVEPMQGRRYLKTFSKKEDIVRHSKWHKKRAETLKFGFLRFSCLDDCKLNGFSATCQFNGKQTHYHCIEADCEKVYISTSDVQMHANYHRKTNAIKLQGFLRVRNLETCQEPSCPYANQQTTHFHCLRDGCQFTFKNKGEMEKHKVYHLKDEQLLSDGFKKFFKGDKCKFANCRYDGKLNHIHCIRPNCNYVFHSSGQLMSHKRKHEKMGQNLDVSVNFNMSDCEASSLSTENHLLDLTLGNTSTGSGCGNGDMSANRISVNSPSTDSPFTAAAAAGQHLLGLSSHLGSAVGGGMMSMPVANNNNNVLQITSIDGLFNRKRGRPPKNRFVEVYNSNVARTSYSPDKIHKPASSAESPQAIFASFKLDKSVTGGIGTTTANDSEGNRENVRKRPKLTEPVPVTTSPVEAKPVMGLIKSKGTFFPNAHADCESNSSESSGDHKANSGDGYDAVDRDEDEDTEGDEQVTNGTTEEDGRAKGLRRNGNGKTNPFMANPPNQQIFPHPGGPAFVPNMFPVNMSAMANNNRDANGLPNFGVEWLKYAYQQANNPLMVFATTAALLAASMNTPNQNPNPNPLESQMPMAMDPSLMEYAKSMFLYNNMQQLAAAGDGTRSATTSGHLSGNAPSLDSSASLQNRLDLADFPRSLGNFPKDEAIPSGYLKFRFNEDCQFATCGYRNHQSHFHCLRDNCFYSFCDKTRFVQHTARHERLDKLMGDDFKQYRSNMNCGYAGCEYAAQQQSRMAEDDDATAAAGNAAKGRNSSKSSHFHCQKCDYICTDTNKVVAHRRQHNKTDFIRLSGFRKVASSESCYSPHRASSPAGAAAGGEATTTDEDPSNAASGAAKCHYSGKQTHYHCLVCNSVVLNRSQLAVHRHKGQPK